MTSPETKYLTVRQAAFIGVGAMVGAGIFALLGAAGEVAGAAVWLSFLIAGVIAALQGYSFAKLGARFPSAGGLIEYVAKGFGDGHVTGVTAWLTYSANAIVTAMVAVSFGSYASAVFTDESAAWVKFFAVLVIVAMTAVNIVGSNLVARAQTVVVYVVIGILVVFAVVTLVNMDPSLLAFSGYPPLQDIVSSVALTFFAFLGFGIITFTAKDLSNPSRQLPRAMFLALTIATVIYVAIALGVFGTLTVEKVIDSGGTALAVAAQPSLGDAGYTLMAITALFATAGATNAGLYPAAGLSERLAETGQFPGLMARRLGGRASVGLLVEAAACVLLAVFFNLDAIASIGSAVALLIFTFITAAHFRVRTETGANALVLSAAIASSAVVLVTFVLTTLIHEPASVITLLGILVLSVALDVGWKRTGAGRARPVAPAT
ncbi:APC family permease [Geodermatophilus ruber]|uniref:Amino acid:proton symporter, ABT family n=1 Tax=Geodermatophilus ruber TaxID=504800 RepID=A0A1I4EBX4_9ACTN|nr:APC family permease [Geodermatophilus ruber]SFL01886.1 amino acid:proton symporter, ABT family [Geodermatophilus ruber]